MVNIRSATTACSQEDTYTAPDLLNALYWIFRKLGAYHQRHRNEGLSIFFMETSDLLRHQIVKSLMAQHTEKVTDAAIDLWEQMATQIISIVGEGGFNSLYARSVFVARITFPWLAAGALPPQVDQRFAGLKMSLEGKTTAQASEANSLLLITFTDILASLIGEQLTTSILRSAWGDDASDLAGREFKNE